MNPDRGISVALPVHNGGQYLQSAVDSILAQTDVLLELVIIDDHSTDSALQNLVVDSRTVILESPRRGIVPALNHGIGHAQYPYIARMDGDDIAHPDRLCQQLKLHTTQPGIDISGTLVNMFSDHADIGGGYRYYQHWINNLTSHADIEREFFVESPIPHPTAMFRRDLFDELGGYRDCDWPEDYDLWCRALLAGKKFAKPECPERVPLLQWRDHQQRLSRQDQRYNKQHFLRCKAHYLSRYLRNRGIDQAVIWGAGKTGLKLHDYLQEEDFSINGFIDVNPNLTGRNKRNKQVQVVDVENGTPGLSETDFILVAVSARGARAQIRDWLRKNGKVEQHNFLLIA